MEKSYGVFDALNSSPETDDERRSTLSLLQTIETLDIIPPSHDKLHRQAIIDKIQFVINTWVYHLLKEKDLDEHKCKNGVLLYPFGSYYLDVYSVSSDIDVLCLFSQDITSDDFFDSFVKFIEKMDDIYDVNCIYDAYVPVIKIWIEGVQLDLLFASIPEETIEPDFDLLNYDLSDIDEWTVVSLNGRRATETILNVVPNVENFKITLRCVKYWATCRGIYSNVFGFFGGINWAILTALVCQLYPNKSPSYLLQRFFRVVLNWKWPKPIVLKKVEHGGPHSNLVFRNDQGKSLMPILTPCYPSMNSSYNTTEHTKAIMLKEFQRGLQTTVKIEQGEANWPDLFEKTSFFEDYSVYLVIKCFSPQNLSEAWTGFVKSKIRNFLRDLEKEHKIQCVHPYPTSVPFDDEEESSVCCKAYFIGIQPDYSNDPYIKLDLTLLVSTFFNACISFKSMNRSCNLVISAHKQSQITEIMDSKSYKRKRVENKVDENPVTKKLRSGE